MIPDFVPSLPVLGAFTAASLLLALTPGPDMTFFMGKTLAQGRKAGIAALLGATSGLVIHTILAAVGVSALLAASQVAFVVLKITGAAYLVWLAVQTLRNGSAFTLKAEKTSNEALLRIWLQGVGINILNPKIVLFFVTFLPQFISAGDPHAVGKLLFLGSYFLVLGLPVCLAMILCASTFAQAVKSSPKAMRMIDWAFAGIMGSFAAKLLTASASN